MAAGLALFVMACQGGKTQPAEGAGKMTGMIQTENAAVATLAGGCFWCVASDMKKLPGVIRVVSGYAGGSEKNPTYETYMAQGHLEAVQVHYDPKVVTYEQILTYFLKHIDPTDAGGQFADRGPGYRSAVFYNDETERKTAAGALQALAACDGAETFYGVLSGGGLPSGL